MIVWKLKLILKQERINKISEQNNAQHFRGCEVFEYFHTVLNYSNNSGFH